MTAKPLSVAVYGGLDTNLVDGSSIWLQSVALMLATLEHVRVTVVLRSPVRRELIIAPLEAHPRISVVDPGARGLGADRLEPGAAASLLAALDAESTFDRLLIRGGEVAEAVVSEGSFDGRIWLYHVPARGADPRAEAEHLRRCAPVCDRLLCQTEAIARTIGAVVPGIEPRLMLLPPMIPGGFQEPPDPDGPIQRLVYAGKFSPEYFFLEMVSLFVDLRRDLPELGWDVAGDKVHNPPDQPDFKPAATQALRTTAGLRWHGAVSRERVRALLLAADVALSLRHPAMDQSSELSTKVLEYGAAGCPALLNRNPTHIDLLGDDYPLLATNLTDARERLLAASADPGIRAGAQRRCFEAAADHTFERVAQKVSEHLPTSVETAEPAPVLITTGSPKLLIAGHQFNFVRPIRDYALEHGAAIREDRWVKHVIHDAQATAEAVAWADVIFCEWCLGAAIWCSHNRRDDQLLTVRFHRMELETPYPAEVDLDRVDAMVFVAQHVLEAACDRYEWPRDHRAFRVIPNAIDTREFAREKLPGAEFTLGLIGWVPMLKRVGRALDILELLRLGDDRFRLLIKGNAPWDYHWMDGREQERAYYEAVLTRIERSPLLRSAVSFEPFGEDLAGFLQKVGWALSLSDIEGHAVAPTEAMASGSIAVVLERPGAKDQFPGDWVHRDADVAARWILQAVAAGTVSAQSALAREFAAQFDWKQVAGVWHELLGLERSVVTPAAP